MIFKISNLSVPGSLLLFAIFCVNAKAQTTSYSSDISEPYRLSSVVWSGDMYEMLNHRVWDQARDYFVVNKRKGRLVARICSDKPFEEALVSTFFNPKESVWGIVEYRNVDSRIPYLASFKGCLNVNQMVNSLEHWLVPVATTLEADEMYPAADVEYLVLKRLVGKTGVSVENDTIFEEQIVEFVRLLKQGKDRIGFVTRKSQTRACKRNAARVLKRLKDEGIDPSRAREIVFKQALETTHKGEFKLEVGYTNERYPELKTIKINKENK